MRRRWNPFPCRHTASKSLPNTLSSVFPRRPIRHTRETYQSIRIRCNRLCWVGPPRRNEPHPTRCSSLASSGSHFYNWCHQRPRPHPLARQHSQPQRLRYNLIIWSSSVSSITTEYFAWLLTNEDSTRWTRRNMNRCAEWPKINDYLLLLSKSPELAPFLFYLPHSYTMHWIF